MDKKILPSILLILFLVIAGILFWMYFNVFFKDISSIKEFILSFGIFAPIVAILLTALQILFAPAPGQVFGFATGFIFGAFFGTIYSMLGLILGSFIAFKLGRKFGRPLLERVVSKENLKKFDKLIKKGGLITLFIIYLLPVLPDDAVTYLAGTTKIKIKKLVFVSTLGSLPGFIVLNLVGAGVATQNSKFSFLLFGIFLVISLLLFIFHKRLEEVMMKVVSMVKNN